MNVVLPELDGRVAYARDLVQGRGAGRSAPGVRQRPSPPEMDRIALSSRDSPPAWARLGPQAARGAALALVLSDYPARGGRAGYAVGLDTPASAAAILPICCRRRLRYRRRTPSSTADVERAC